MSKIIEGLKYSESHEWVKVEGNIAYIGVTDFAQKEMGDRKSTRLNSSHITRSRMPSSA